MCRLWRDEAGQMSVFMALIFQVLFVFFAMVINIGMVVHDKINLQNAVDLGAYYAAERQAEILNEIAHLNYQIRQDYKLLVWRYRVLGTLGKTGTGGLAPALNPGALAEGRWVNSDQLTTGQWIPPSVCIETDQWSDLQQLNQIHQNLCQRGYQSKLPAIPVIPDFKAPIPGLAAARASAILAQQQIISTCTEAGPLNWAFLMNMIYMYKMSIASKKIVIEQLRKKLVDPNFLDIHGESVREGALKTVKNNLTSSNLSTFDDRYFEVKNGLAEGRCAMNGGEFTLPEVKIAPLYFYTTFTDNSDCSPGISYHEQIPNGAGIYGPLLGQFAGEPDPNDPEMGKMQSSLGYEKNPWCMAYVGVRAKTSPRKPFSPFSGKGDAPMVARSFAQPFGGRIGPWYRDHWNQGDEISSGQQKTDELVPPRLLPSRQLDDQDPQHRLANYSRYPGDLLGYDSALALGAERNAFARLSSRSIVDRLKLIFYQKAYDEIQTTGDPLIWDSQNNQIMPGSVQEFMRPAEVAAVAPDLFDATYYSVDPAYKLNYRSIYERDANIYGGALPFLMGVQIQVPPDLGGHNGISGIDAFDIRTQIQTVLNGGVDQQLLTQIFWLIRKPEHLLTAWSAYSLQDFQTFPVNRFGQCEKWAPNSLMIPGACIQGGRTGYSVRFVSREYLLSSEWKVGGEAGGVGPILNPPDNTW